MSEFNRISENKGIYVKMKLLNRNGRKSKSFFYKCFKWVLWISFSLYFFSSYLITTSTKTTSPLSLSKITFPISKPTFVSRALFEFNTTVLQKPITRNVIPSSPSSKIFTELSSDLKIYIYDLPSKYNSDWLLNKRCSNHLFAAEVAIHKALMSSEVRTLNPFEADFFFVPVYVSCNFSIVNGFPSLGHARPLLKSAIDLISSTMPFWNRTNGSDHIFVATHDYGACFHAMEEDAIVEGIPKFLKKSIILQTFGVKSKHPCQEVENILIPPYISPEKIQSTVIKSVSARNGKRDIWAFFRGKMEINPKNINGRIYSKGVRTMIWKKFSRFKRKFYLKRQRFDGYQSEIGRSVFCLCPLGWAPWSPRIVESVALGCIPVIIADDIRLPFSNTIRWSEISLTIKEKDVGRLGKILEHVAATNLTMIQKNLWDPINRRSLLYNNEIQEGDATWQILNSLSKMMHLSYRRSKLSDFKDDKRGR